MDKRGIELSINVFVGIILGLFMFGAGIAIFAQIYSGVIDTSDRVTEEIEQRLTNSFDYSNTVFVTRQRYDLSNERSLFVPFLIANLGESSDSFRVNVENYNSADISVAFIDESYTLNPRETRVLGFIVDVSDLGSNMAEVLVELKDSSGDRVGDPRIVRIYG